MFVQLHVARVTLERARTLAAGTPFDINPIISSLSTGLAAVLLIPFAHWYDVRGAGVGVRLLDVVTGNGSPIHGTRLHSDLTCSITSTRQYLS